MMEDIPDKEGYQEYEQLLREEWTEKVYDDCTVDWQKHWLLDGKKAKIVHDERGMELHAGPEFRDDAAHAVLWTKDYFEGDVKIEFEYTRLDQEIRCVNIIYIQATGKEEGPYSRDIADWAELREVPAMKEYFGNMFTYHVSYAAFEGPDDDYIRARRYMGSDLQGTELKPDYFRTGLFETGVAHRFSFVKTERDIYLKITAPDKTQFCHWHNADFPPITEGRIGLRHMFTRAARYRDIRMSVRS